MKPTEPTNLIDRELARIAAKYLNLEKLEVQNSDGLDFKEQAVWDIRAALAAAYAAGRNSAGK